MQYLSIQRIVPLFILLGGLLFTGCKKVADSASDSVEILTNSADDAEADIVFNGVFNDVTGVDSTIAITSTEVGAPETAPPPPNPATRCYTVTVTPTTPGVFPKTVTIDFGTGCLGRDGRYRKGKVITVFSDWLRKPGATAITTFNGHYVNDVLVEGKHTIKNISTSAARVFSRVVDAGKLTKTNGNYILWDAAFTHSQVAGVETPLWYWDDAFTITGSATGESSRNGKIGNWTRAIGEALHRFANCRWRDKGTVVLTFNKRTATLDFGAGSCDDKATISFLGFTKEITL